MPQQRLSRTTENQLGVFIEEGLIVHDGEEERKFLSRISACRLNVYCHVFRSAPAFAGDFRTGTNLGDVIKLYEFDRDLRLLVFDAIERIEINMRKQFSDCIMKEYGPFGHLEGRNFHPGFVNPHNSRRTSHSDWIERLRAKVSNPNTFDGIPICQLTEKMTFSLLIHGIIGMRQNDKGFIATRFTLGPHQIGLWLKALGLSRNICSHHGRLWNQKFTSLNNIHNREGKILDLLLIIGYLLQGIENCGRWKRSIEDLLLQIEENGEWNESIGLSDNWQEHAYWR